MALALRISGKTKNGQEVTIEPSWWNKDQLRNTYHFEEEGDYYLDYYLYVNKQVFQEIMESQETFRNKPIYQDKYWIGQNDQTRAELDYLVQNLQEDSTVKIWIYEWESGF